MKETSKILSELRNLMKNLPNGIGTISAYIVPSEDAHQSEYICEADERRNFISGFDGSKGTAVITQSEALMWTDGRYYQQARSQMDNNWTLMKEGLADTPTIGAWLAKNLKKGDQIGCDGNLLSSLAWSQIHVELQRNENVLRSIDDNLIDRIWLDRPKRTSNPIITLTTEITGATINEKIVKIRAEMTEKGADVLVVTALDEVACKQFELSHRSLDKKSPIFFLGLLNMRGSDIEYNPVFFAYVIVTLDKIYLFLDQAKLPSNATDHFEQNQVKIELLSYDGIRDKLTALAQPSSSRVWISSSSSYALTALIPLNNLYQEITPICKMKAVKTTVEAQGMIDCHIRDGVALCQYFAWLENALELGEYVDEISGATKLEEFRKKQDKFMGLSFATISGSGPNGSIIHYHPEESTKRQITKSEIYLCDSGAQYLDGTTDVTRTWHFGTPTAYQKECFTRVLKGQINMGTAVFPNKSKGNTLDTLARKYLWDVGLDYRHGTGHGVGHFLNVHEGPMSIHYRYFADDPGLEKNMFVSNEPGYYEDGEFGIRIEDIVQIVGAETKGNFKGIGALTFRTITMCPIQTKLIDRELMTATEKLHLNAYHKTVYDTLAPLLWNVGDTFTVAWLKKETEPI
ncbi:hypothetical protein HA402_010769 [Bradysia odoriphaga]|nr:hypothetical protein HA402_010769 [Bradysia odoriphaga]